MIKANLRVHPASLLNGEGASIPLKIGQGKGAVRYSQAACILEDDAPITIPEHELLNASEVLKPKEQIKPPHSTFCELLNYGIM